MRALTGFAFLAFTLLPPIAASRADELGSLDRAVDVITNQGGRCARNVLPELQDIRQELSDGDTRAAARHAYRLEHRADSWCGRDATRALRHLRESLDDRSDGDAAPPPAPRSIAVSASVDMACVQAMKSTYAYGVGKDNIVGWLTECRASWPADCALTRVANPTCQAKATSLATFLLSDDDRAQIATACETLQCSVPQSGQYLRTSVDVKCFSQQKAAYPYGVAADKAVEWLTACRSTLPANGTCKVVTAHYNAACFATAQRSVTYLMTPENVVSLLANCKDVDELCQ